MRNPAAGQSNLFRSLFPKPVLRTMRASTTSRNSKCTTAKVAPPSVTLITELSVAVSAMAIGPLHSENSVDRDTAVLLNAVVGALDSLTVRFFGPPPPWDPGSTTAGLCSVRFEAALAAISPPASWAGERVRGSHTLGRLESRLALEWDCKRASSLGDGVSVADPPAER